MLKLGMCSQDISTGRCSVKKLRVQQIFGEELGEDVLKKNKDAFKHHSLFICTHLSSDVFFRCTSACTKLTKHLAIGMIVTPMGPSLGPRFVKEMKGWDAGDGIMSRVSNDL